MKQEDKSKKPYARGGKGISIIGSTIKIKLKKRKKKHIQQRNQYSLLEEPTQVLCLEYLHQNEMEMFRGTFGCHSIRLTFRGGGWDEDIL